MGFDTNLGKACSWSGKIPEAPDTNTSTQDTRDSSSAGGSYGCQAKPEHKKYRPVCLGRKKSDCENFQFSGSAVCTWLGGNGTEKPEPQDTTSTAGTEGENADFCNLDLGEYRKKCVVRSQKKCPPGRAGQKCAGGIQDLVNDSDPYCSRVQRECFPTRTTSSEGENADPCNLNLAEYRKKCVKPSSQKCDSSTGAKCPSVVDTTDPYCSEVQRECISDSVGENETPQTGSNDSAFECSFNSDRTIITCPDGAIYDIRRRGLIDSVTRLPKPVDYSDQGREPAASQKGQAVEQN